ncbi:MAG: hypothetical protein IKA62_06880 [Clostridia bacterium]|nr:hypothetical protein [Clostridia bacterium]
MTDLIISNIYSILAVAIFIAFAVFCVMIFTTKKSSSGNEKIENDDGEYLEANPDFFDDEYIAPEPVLVGARVISKAINETKMGTKLPSYKMNFVVTFLTDDGDTVEFCVNEDIYNRVYVDQVGDLVTINGTFFDFGDGEELVQ